MKKEEIELTRIKAQDRLNVNLWLLGIVFTIFTFIIAVNPDLLRTDRILAVQLALTIPLFLDSIFARTRMSYSQKVAVWNNYGFITFVLGYAFLTNVIGLLLAFLVSTWVSMVFFIVSICSAVVYSFFEVSENKSRLKERFYKDLFFIMVIVILGILPALRIY
jgi:hypothetical protein